MPKKRKHHETCSSCAFVHAHRLKYGRGRYEPEAFNGMAYAALKVAALVMSRMDNGGKATFITNLLGYTAHLERRDPAEIGAAIDARMDMTMPSAAKGPTKH